MRRTIVLVVVLLSAGSVAAEEITTTPLQFYGLGTLTCAAWSPDGRQIVTGGSAGAFLWDVATSHVVRMFIGHTREVVAVAISPDGSLVLTGSADGTVRVWRTADGTTIRTFTDYTGHPNSVAFTTDGTKALIPQVGGNAVYLRNISNGAIARIFFGHTGEILSATISADGTKVATGSVDGTAKLWDIATGAALQTINASYPEIVAVSPNGAKLLTCYGNVNLWDTSNGNLLWTSSGPNVFGSIAFSADGQSALMGTGDGWLLTRGTSATSNLDDWVFAGASPLISVATSSDGNRLLTALSTPENVLEIWDANNLPRDIQFVGHTSTVNAVAFAPDGTQVLTGSYDRTARLWNIADGSEIQRFSVAASVLSAAFSPDGTKVATASADYVARLWRISDGALLTTFTGHTHPYVSSVAFSPDGTMIVTGSYDQTAKLWNAADGSEVRTFLGHSNEVTAVAFSPDGTKILTGSGLTARLWNVSDGAMLTSFTGATNGLSAVAFSPDGTKCLTAAWDTARLYNVADGSLIRIFSGGAYSMAAAFSPDGTKIITAGDATARLWNVADGTILRSFAHSNNVYAVAFSPDGEKILTGFGSDARVWHIAPSAPALSGHMPSLGPVAVVGDGSLLATGHDDGAARLWSAADGILIRTFAGHTQSISCLALSSTGSLLVTGSNDRTIKLWTTGDGQLVRTFTGHTGRINSVALSSDGTQMISASDDGLAVLWNVATGAASMIFSGHGGPIYGAALSPEGTRVLTGGIDTTAKMWSAATGGLIRTFSGHLGSVRSVAFSPDGMKVVTGAGDVTAKLWNASDGTEIRTLSGHSNAVEFVAFSPDGTRVITAGDTTARLWNAEDGSLLQTVAHIQSLTGAALSADAARLVTGSQDAMARLWSLQPGQGGGPSGRVLRGDKMMIVAGGGNFSGNPIVGQTQALAERAYLTCLVRGYRRSEIRYLSAFNDWQTRDSNGDGLPDADAQATTQALWSAIDEWSSGTARLFVYLVDHGSYNPGSNPPATANWYFRLNPNDYISAHDLDAHLDALQAATGCEVILIVDTCYSGGFVQECAATSGTRRIVIASTTPTDLSIYTPPVGAESFSHFFFSFAILGNTLRDCFDWTRMAFQSMGNPAGQMPWMDDDNDGDSDKDDGALASRHVLGRYPAFGLNAPTITAVASTPTVEVGQPALLWAQIGEAVAAREVWALVIPQGQTYAPGQPVTELMRVDLVSSPTANRWEGRFTRTGQFAGRCSVIYFAMSEDALHTQLLATPVASGLVVEGDRYEVDDTATSATEYVFSATPMYDDQQVHNFHDDGDVDWIWFYGRAGYPYSLHVRTPGPNCDPVIAIYDSTTATAPLSEPVDLHGLGQEETWTTLSLTRTGIYYFKLLNFTPSLYGEGTSYTLQLTEDTGANIGLAIALGSRSGHISWDPEPGHGPYNVYRWPLGGMEPSQSVNGSLLPTEEYVDTGLQPSTGYFYRVKTKPASGPEAPWAGVGFGMTQPESTLRVEFDAPTTAVTESAGTVPVRLHLSAPSSSRLEVYYRVSGTAMGGGADYSMPPEPLVFAPGETRKSIPVTIVDDSNPELAETVVVTLEVAVGVELGTGITHTLTILDNEGALSVGFDRTAQSVREDATSVSARVVLSAVSATTVSVSYSTANGTAAAGSDYLTTAGTLTFAPGQTAKFIRVRILNDLIYGRDETFSIRLPGATNATITTGTQTVTILETDRPQVRFLLATSSANENVGRTPIWVKLTKPSTSGASVHYAVTGGTATRGQDYTIATGMLTFRRNAVSTSITVNVLDDVRDESNETIILSLSNPTTATLGSPSTHSFTILDNDPPPTVGFAQATGRVPETIGVARVLVRVTPPSEKTIGINFATANGTALAGRDYLTTSGVLSLTALQTTATVNVRILAPHQRGTHRTLQINLTNPQNATLGIRVHTLTIDAETRAGRWFLYR